MLLRMTRPWLALCAALAACASQPEPAPPANEFLSLLPGSIGLFTKGAPGGVVVAEVQKEGAAVFAGVRPGDVVLRFNGVPVSSVLQFNRLMLGSQPGSTARLVLRRAGELREVELPVREVDTMPRG
jgi:S1-C subfamily serine protease